MRIIKNLFKLFLLIKIIFIISYIVYTWMQVRG